ACRAPCHRLARPRPAGPLQPTRPAARGKSCARLADGGAGQVHSPPSTTYAPSLQTKVWSAHIAPTPSPACCDPYGRCARAWTRNEPERVALARARGRSWNRIAVALGVSRQAARHRFASKVG